jgi:hypothetical protein
LSQVPRSSLPPRPPVRRTSPPLPPRRCNHFVPAGLIAAVFVHTEAWSLALRSFSTAFGDNILPGSSEDTGAPPGHHSRIHILVVSSLQWPSFIRAHGPGCSWCLPPLYPHLGSVPVWNSGPGRAIRQRCHYPNQRDLHS